jgi:diguanylate cyclase (GGDEF)-like protein
MEDRDRVVLQACLLFRGIPLESVEGLLEACAVREAAAGARVLAPSRYNQQLYIVLEGEVDVHLDEPGPTPYARLGPGNCLGELSVIDRKRPSATVMAASAVRLLVLEPDVLWAMVDSNRDFARNLLYVVSGRVRFESRALIESHRARAALEQQVATDGLTGLHNRRFMIEAFPRQLERCLRGQKPVSLLMLDVDHFKAYNDGHGHQAGDAVLRNVARVLHAAVRPDDLLCRYGGEEFSVLLPGASASVAVEAAERLRAAVAAALIVDPEGRLLPPVTVSIGLAEAIAGDALDDLTRRADRALYRAKGDGRNCVRQ